MSNIFNFDRFVKVLNYDVKRIVQNYGLAMIILAVMPYIYSFVYGFFAFLFGDGWQFPTEGARWMMFFFVCAIFILSYGANAYGYITDKKAGSAYIMLPASATEKFLSMFVNSAIIIPLVLVAAYLLNDWIIVKLGLASGRQIIGSTFVTDNIKEGISVNLWALGLISMSINVLIFLLGSIFFEKRKIAMTILVLFGLQTLFSVIIMMAAKYGMNNIEGNELERFFLRNTGNLNLWLNAFIDISMAVEYLVLGILIFLRIKTIKH